VPSQPARACLGPPGGPHCCTRAAGAARPAAPPQTRRPALRRPAAAPRSRPPAPTPGAARARRPGSPTRSCAARAARVGAGHNKREHGSHRALKSRRSSAPRHSRTMLRCTQQHAQSRGLLTQEVRTADRPRPPLTHAAQCLPERSHTPRRSCECSRLVCPRWRGAAEQRPSRRRGRDPAAAAPATAATAGARRAHLCTQCGVSGGEGGPTTSSACRSPMLNAVRLMPPRLSPAAARAASTTCARAAAHLSPPSPRAQTQAGLCAQGGPRAEGRERVRETRDAPGGRRGPPRPAGWARRTRRPARPESSRRPS